MELTLPLQEPCKVGQYYYCPHIACIGPGAACTKQSGELMAGETSDFLILSIWAGLAEGHVWLRRQAGGDVFILTTVFKKPIRFLA